MKIPNPYVVGLDIGTTKIAAIVGRHNEHGKLDILGYGKAESLGVRRGMVVNIQSTVAAIKKAVQEASESAGLPITSVNVGIAGQHIRSELQTGRIIRKNSDEEISEEDILTLIDNMYDLGVGPGEEVIDVVPQEYVVDGENGVKQPIGMLGSSLEARFQIIIGQTLAAKNIYKCVTQAGLEVIDLILEPIASAKAVLGEDEKEAGVALVDIGGGTTDIAIFYDSVIRHTAVIPFGGDIVTKDIREGCNLIQKHAEELKIRYGSALESEKNDNEIVSIQGTRGKPPKEISVKALASIIQARVEEIIDQVRYEIKLSGYERKLHGGIVLTGGGSLLKNIAQLTEFMLGVDVRIGYPDEHLSNTAESKKTSNPMFSTGIGLTLEGLERIEREITKEIKRQQNILLQNSKSKEPEIIELQIEEEEPKKKKQRVSFLQKVQRFFEDDEM